MSILLRYNDRNLPPAISGQTGRLITIFSFCLASFCITAIFGRIPFAFGLCDLADVAFDVFPDKL